MSAPTDRDDLHPAVFTRDEAIAAAQRHGTRDVAVTDTRISYIAYVSGFHDFCYCEFVPEASGWVENVRVLQPAERLPSEAITDATIGEVARAGDMISAIRLYRTKHQVGFAKASAAVRALATNT